LNVYSFFSHHQEKKKG